MASSETRDLENEVFLLLGEEQLQVITDHLYDLLVSADHDLRVTRINHALWFLKGNPLPVHSQHPDSVWAPMNLDSCRLCCPLGRRFVPWMQSAVEPGGSNR